MTSLKKYQGLFDLNVKKSVSKTELVKAVKKHFARHPKFREGDVIAEFLHKVRR